MNNPQQEQNNDSESTEVGNLVSTTELTLEMTTEEVAQAVKNSAHNRFHRSRNWQSGDELKNGKYIIEKELGRGGFGITYLATSARGELVVIKILKDELLARDDFNQLEEDFVNEAYKLNQFKHPNIVPIIEVIKDNGCWCIVMEYIQGKTLEATVGERNDYLSEGEALNYIKQIGAALKEVHAQGLLHRDIKPQNIMIREDTKDAVLIDFGLALKFNRNPVVNSGGLSHGYAPLEQYQLNVIWDYYTDVYALAATLYFVLTKTKPISAKERASAKKLVPAKDLNPAISQYLNQALELGMSLDPASRPETINIWLELLEKKERNRLTWKVLSVLLPLGLGLFTTYLFFEKTPISSDWELKLGKSIEKECTINDLHLLTQKCHHEKYFFTGNKGEQTIIEMNSDEIDPLLILMDANGKEIARNDDIDVNNQNARIIIELPKDGIYQVNAQSSQEQESGTYTIRRVTAN